jgi:hypothetical protein
MLVQCWAMGWMAEELGFSFWQVQELFFAASRLSLGLTQPPVYGLQGQECVVEL